MLLKNSEDPYRIAENFSSHSSPINKKRSSVEKYNSGLAFKERSLLTQVHNLRKASGTP
jgi:hypothetical protein